MPHTPVLWQQSSTYPAGADRQLLGALWPAGGALGAAVSAVANTMQVSIAPGSAAVALQSGQGSALCHWDTAEVLTLDASPPSGQSRVDLIVCQVRDPDLDGGLNSDFVLMAVKGTPAAFTADTRPGDKEGDEPRPSRLPAHRRPYRRARWPSRPSRCPVPRPTSMGRPSPISGRACWDRHRP